MRKILEDLNRTIMARVDNVLLGIESQGKMKNNYQSSAMCHHGKAINHYPSYVGNFGDGFINPLLNIAYFAPPTEGYHIPLCPPNVYVWPAYHPDNQSALQNNYSHIGNQFYSANGCYIPDNIQNPYTLFGDSVQIPGPEFNNFQEFDYFVVIDFEATCDKERNPYPQEIIEFPAIMVDSRTGELVDYFQAHVRPTHHPKLSDFCKELTGIQQFKIDKGIDLKEALVLHDQWLEGRGVKQTKFVVVTWSNWDCQVMLESECRFKNIQKPAYFDKWINLRVAFNKMFGGIRCNLKEAVQLAGLEWIGRAHCGLDDAMNTARLLVNLMQRGVKLSVTNTLTWQLSDTTTKVSTQAQQDQALPAREQNQESQRVLCYCGVECWKEVIIKQEDLKAAGNFYCCGNSAADGGAICNFSEWDAL